MKTSQFLLFSIFTILCSASYCQTTYSYNFEADYQAWDTIYADYSPGMVSSLQMDSSHEIIPDNASLPGQTSGIYVQSMNVSDDVFMGMKKHITGLLPNTNYNVFMDIYFASNSPSNSAGIGGAPGEAVIMKAGVVVSEPVVIYNSNYNLYRLNIDIGDHQVGGEDMLVIGNVANGSMDIDGSFIALNNNNLSNLFSFRTDCTGSAWLIVGTDSGFEGFTPLYYDSISYTFTEEIVLANEYDYNFENDYQGWDTIYADYSPGMVSSLQMDSSHEIIPDNASLPGQTSGIYVQSMNVSDDVFMGMKKHITGLLPNTTYNVCMDIYFASNSPSNSAGIGGAPGEAVFMKAGVVLSEPLVIYDPSLNRYQLNLDKGNQALDGDDMFLIGNVANGSMDIDGPFIALNNNNLNNLFSFTTDCTGSAWLIVGTDSGYEGFTPLYYDSISYKFNKEISLAVEDIFFEVEMKNENQVEFLWNYSSGKHFTNFELQYSKDGNDFKSFAFMKSNPGQNEYQYLLENHYQNKYYRLLLKNSDGRSTYSDIKSISLDFMLTDPMVFPNPFENNLYYSTNDKIDAIEIYDMSSAKIKTIPVLNNSGQIDLSSIPKGGYILRFLYRGKHVSSIKTLKL